MLRNPTTNCGEVEATPVPVVLNFSERFGHVASGTPDKRPKTNPVVNFHIDPRTRNLVVQPVFHMYGTGERHPTGAPAVRTNSTNSGSKTIFPLLQYSFLLIRADPVLKPARQWSSIVSYPRVRDRRTSSDRGNS